MNARIYNWMSDRGLRKKDFKARTPLVVLENNRILSPHTPRLEKFEECEGKSVFHNKFVHFSTSENIKFDAQNYKIALSSEFPLRTPNMISWWLYKGYKMKTSIPQKPKYSEKNALIYVRMRMVDRISSPPPILRVAEKEKSLEATDDIFEGSLEYTVPNSDWNMSLETQYRVLTFSSKHLK